LFEKNMAEKLNFYKDKLLFWVFYLNYCDSFFILNKKLDPWRFFGL
jgi:hypothetical protein